jgi:hypothetical protein
MFPFALQQIRKRTIWIMDAPEGGFVAVNNDGEIVGRHKHKSTLEFIVRKAPDLMKDTYAIAYVINPANRQPNRKISYKHPRAWSLYTRYG